MAAIGIDLGTTYSCVAVSEEGKFEVIANDQGERTTPSCVAFTDKERRLIGQATKQEMLKNPKQTVIGIKRIIGRRFDDPVVQQEMKNWEFDIVDVQGQAKIQIERNGGLETFYPEQISAMILADLKKTAEDYIGKDVKKAVITVPAYFNNCQRSATKDAATIAGLDVIGMINEPTAAALAYGVQKKITSTRNVLVFDLGGGTFDVTLMTITNGGRVFDVIATAGDTHLGGVDFTRCVQKYFEEDFEAKTKRKFRASSRTKARMVKECEEVKKMLSTQFSQSIFLENVSEGEDLDSEITRAAFDKLTKDKFDRTLDLVKQVLDDSKMEKSQVDDVLLVGGSTRIPSIQEMLKNYFGADKIRKNTNPDEAVAAGAALHADFLSRQELSQSPEVVLKDVTPLSLGTRVEGGNMSVIIKRNTKIPAKTIKRYQTARDNQHTICVKVYEGEQPKSKDNNFLGKFRFSGIPPKPATEGKIELVYEIDSFGVLNVSAIEKDTRKNESISISMEEGRMPDEEILRLIEKAENERQVELESRIKNSAMNELESLINSVKLQVEDEQAASESIEDPILKKCAEIETWINENQETSLEEIRSKRAILDELQTLF